MLESWSMKKVLVTVVLGLLLNVNAYAGKYEMEQAAKTIPGVADAAFQGSSSFWVKP